MSRGKRAKPHFLKGALQPPQAEDERIVNPMEPIIPNQLLRHLRVRLIRVNAREYFAYRGSYQSTRLTAFGRRRSHHAYNNRRVVQHFAYKLSETHELMKRCKTHKFRLPDHPSFNITISRSDRPCTILRATNSASPSPRSFKLWSCPRCLKNCPDAELRSIICPGGVGSDIEGSKVGRAWNGTKSWQKTESGR